MALLAAQCISERDRSLTGNKFLSDNDIGVEPLMELARTAREAETRRAAMFWLAQSEDPRVLSIFEEIQLGR